MRYYWARGDHLDSPYMMRYGVMTSSYSYLWPLSLLCAPFHLWLPCVPLLKCKIHKSLHSCLVCRPANEVLVDRLIRLDHRRIYASLGLNWLNPAVCANDRPESICIRVSFILANSPALLRLQVSWWRHQMETFSALLAICAENSPVPGEFPAQNPVTRSFDVFFDLHPNKRLSKQWWGWWFETSSRRLWRHRNVLELNNVRPPVHVAWPGTMGTSALVPYL